MSFLNPALLAGTLLFAVPLIIHLLNQQRHKKRPWAAMEYLLRAFQKQRNRLRRENLLLLLLRCLLPIVLALAIARPIWKTAAGLFAGAGIVHHVVVVDGSYSMGHRQDGGASSFERARGLVGKLLDRFEQNSQRNDKVSLVLAGVRPRFLVRGDLDLATVRNQWLLMQRPDDAAGELVDALQQVVRALEEQSDPEVRVYVLTDLQARAFGKALGSPEQAPAPELNDTVRDVVEQLQQREGLELHWIDTGPFAGQRQGGLADNVQISDLRISQPAAVLRSPVEVVATVKNRGQQSVDCEVTLEVDGGEPLRKLVRLAAGAEGEADFQVVFREGGRRRLRASLAGDALTADDERFVTVEVRDRIRILLVDGEAGGDPLQAHRFLWQMLDPDATALPTFAVETVDIVSFLGGQCTPKNHDVTVLADVERLNDRATKSLLEALQAAKGVFVLLGERADGPSYNLHLHGDGPLPFRLAGKAGGNFGTAKNRTATLVAPEHPLLREFGEQVWREVLQNVPIWRWHSVAAEALPQDAQVIARLNDAEQTPLLVARPFAEGRVVWLTSALASVYKPDRWNLLDDPQVALPLLFGIVQWLALPAVDPFAVEVGAELACSLPA
ncbi:MAG: BatA domain-containing protein, partial [Planctomycetota bacterium]